VRSFLLLVTSSPSSPESARAFHLALLMRSQGNQVSVFLGQNGVLAAICGDLHTAGTSVAQALAAGIHVYALNEDLVLRGWGPGDVIPGVQVSGYDELAELALEESATVSGAF